MNANRTWIGLGVALVIACTAGVVVATQQDKKATDAASAADQMPTPKPGPEHAMLKKMVGTWDATITSSWMGTSETSKGVTVYKAIGDFWVVEDFEGEMMGQKFTGHGITGFDPDKKKYVGTWVDNMGPALVHGEGTVDASGKLNMTHETSMNGQATTMTSVSEWKDADNMVFTMSMGGSEMMKIEYKRKK